MTRVSGVLVTHGPDPFLQAAIDAVADQVDEFVVIANLPPFAERLPPGTVLVENERPQGFAANANLGIASTTGEYVALLNPDAVVSPGAVAGLVDFAEARPRCGVVGPQLVYPDGRWQPSRRRFPELWGTLVRRTPLRRVLDPARFSRAHYMTEDERPTHPVEVDWMLGGVLLLRRAMLDEIGWFDEHFRLYVEDIDLCRRAQRSGWERWYDPRIVVQHTHNAVTDRTIFTRRTLWHWSGMARYVAKHGLREPRDRGQG